LATSSVSEKGIDDPAERRDVCLMPIISTARISAPVHATRVFTKAKGKQSSVFAALGNKKPAGLRRAQHTGPAKS